jgi:hypothetical protein
MPMKPPGGMPAEALGGANLPVVRRMVPLMRKAAQMKNAARMKRAMKK